MNVTSKSLHIAFSVSNMSPGGVRVTLGTNGFSWSADAAVSAMLNAASNKNVPSSKMAPITIKIKFILGTELTILNS